MPVRFHPRATLGLGPPVLARLQRRTADEQHGTKVGFTRHWVGDGGTLYHPNPITRLQNIYGYHVHTLGYGDIAYEGAFDAGGNVYELRNSVFVGAHAGSTGNVANRLTDGIVYLEDARGWTTDAWSAFTWWRNLFRLVLGREPIEYAHEWWAQGHGGLPTQCPGPAVRNAVRIVGGNI